MGMEAEFLTGGDICGEVVDVEGFFRSELVFLDGVVVDFRVGFDRIDFVGEDGAVEDGEFRERFKDPWAVDGVGVGKKDEAVTVLGEFAHLFPHG